MAYVVALIAMFVYTFTKSANQFNVLRLRYWWVWPYSFAMQACFVYVVSQIAIHKEVWIILPLAAGAALGSNAAMFMNQKWMGEGENND